MSRFCGKYYPVSQQNRLRWLFQINKEDLASLNGHEKNYKIASVIVTDEESITYEAVVYLREKQKKGKPNELYRKIVIKGAKDCGLQSDYLMKNL